MLLALDPGCENSAVVSLWADKIDGFIMPNQELLRWLGHDIDDSYTRGWTLVIEQVESYGMPVGREVFETVFWSGRFAQAWAARGGVWILMPRRAVKLALCGSPRATDATIRQALVDRFGPGKDRAIGRKASPGPLYGIKADMWQALALGVVYQEMTQNDRSLAASK